MTPCTNCKRCIGQSARRDAHARDARAMCLSLPPDGMALAANAMRIQTEVVRVMVDGSSDTEMQTLQNIMEHAAFQLETLLDARQTSVN